MVGIDTDQVRIYFANTKTYEQHADFLEALGYEWYEAIDGSLTYAPDLVGRDGNPGVYYYYLEPSYSFSLAARFYTVLAASMPLVEDNLAFHIRNSQLRYYQSDLPLFWDSRVSLAFERDIYSETDFLALNPGEGYGLLRVRDADERPPRPRCGDLRGAAQRAAPRRRHHQHRAPNAAVARQPARHSRRHS